MRLARLLLKLSSSLFRTMSRAIAKFLPGAPHPDFSGARCICEPEARVYDSGGKICENNLGSRILIPESRQLS